MIPGWLLHGDLPPVGGRVHLGRDEKSDVHFPGYSPHWVQSGTAALALGFMLARQARPDVRNPVVILPAYGCPDLIAAAEFAEVMPVLVDIDVDDPGYDLACLDCAIDADTVAVVAVNFLGIRERLAGIRDVLSAHPGVMLIEDNAQWFPEPLSAAELVGDMTVLSFGRGKPVSLLGGGALLVREGCVADVPDVAPAIEAGSSLTFKGAAFNALLHRRLYAVVNRNPLFELGKTEFKPLREVRAMDSLRRCSTMPAAQHYLTGSRATEQAWQQVCGGLSLAGPNVDSHRRGRLLRYPILCQSREQRDCLWQQLDSEGLGASAMYRVALPEVSGVTGKYRLAGDYTNAHNLAERLLTLPVHLGVTQLDIARSAKIFSDL